MLDLIIEGGDVVTPQGVARLDVAVAGEAIAVVAAGSIGLRACSSSATGRDVGSPAVVEAPPVALPVGPAAVVGGVPHGWRHDAEGGRELDERRFAVS